NAATRPWARDLARSIVKDADWWLGQSDQAVYNLVPVGNPRALCPNFERGCPLHGGARYSFEATLEQPYRWRCRQGGESWFDGAVIKNPTSGEEVTIHDDGHGWLAPPGFPEAGRRYYFVAAYRYFLLGKLFASPYEPDGGSAYRGGTPVTQLALAYALTGDARYAHKAAVMLLRLADLYSTYDGAVEGPSQRQDGYIGQTSERFLVQNLILACDLIWDALESDTELAAFFAAQGSADFDADGRLSGADLTFHLQRDLLGYVYEYLHRLMPYLDGDFLMYEMTALAALAHALGNPALAAEALESDLGLRVLLNNSWFRDGKFIYDASGYNDGNARTPLLIAEWLHGFTAPPAYPEPLDLYHHPDYRMAMLFDFLRDHDCDGRVPQIGDTGGARTQNLRSRPPYGALEERALLRLPEQREEYRQRLLTAAGGDLEALRQGTTDWWLLFHAEEPLAGTAPPEVAPRPRLFEDGQVAILRAGASPGSRLHVPLTFSKGSYAHGHLDKLAINLIRYGYDFTADLGYPTTWTDLKCNGWEKHTASHALVMLDQQPQRGNAIGKLSYHAAEPALQAIEASCEDAYPQASLYRRSVALVCDEGGEPLYVADFFRVAGAAVRDYLFHSLGPPEALRVDLSDQAPWVAQPAGSLAGPGVPPASQPGYGFLGGVQRAFSAGDVTATWQVAGSGSQPDRYLLTRETFRQVTLDFTLTRTGRASGARERAVLVFAIDPRSPNYRRVVMLPVGSFPIGQAVPVRLVVDGEQAALTVAGQPSGTVDVVGQPGEQGSIGFLHYYNYGWEYRDLVITAPGRQPQAVDLTRPLDPAFWTRIDPTYEAAEGILRVADARPMTMTLRAPGRAGREVIRAQAEGHGVRGKSPHEGHLILRERLEDAAVPTVFETVLEPVEGEARVRAVSRLTLAPAAPTASGLRVETPGRVDYLLSSTDEVGREIQVDGHRISFEGRLGLVRFRAGRLRDLVLVGAGELVCDGRRLSQPGFAGEVIAVDPATQSVTVRSAADGQWLPGTILQLTSPGRSIPSLYTVLSAEAAGADAWRLTLNLPFLLARGVVAARDAVSFGSRTPIMKLRVNPGLFDGKLVAPWPTGRVSRLKTATEAAFEPRDPAALSDFPPGAEYAVYDAGVGDAAVVVPAASWSAPE
ncbi:MAG: heparinase II/III family protein, partial [Armatimonadetes bacterium]|nr:heparinase II/III family protein [Armatimonadota bacterium]